MAQLGVDVRTHMPRGSDGRRVTARSKGKVERPFLTVKEAHKTLYHFHTPQNEVEANLWLHTTWFAITTAVLAPLSCFA